MLATRYFRAPQFSCCLIVTLAVCTCSAFASTSGASSDALLREYNAAIAQKQPTDKIRKLEQFAWTTSGPLRADALEVVVWEYLRAGNNARALTWANELNLADKANPLALAVICQEAQHSSQTKAEREQLHRMASQGERALPRLRHPVGMSDTDFAALRRQASIMLERASGQPMSQGGDRATARWDRANSARNDSGAAHSSAKAVAHTSADLDNVQRMYRRAMADLKHKNSNHRQDFWDLARAVVLSGGSIQGHPVAEDARICYLRDGGTNAGWNQFLIAAAAANPSLAPSARFASSHAGSGINVGPANTLAQASRHTQTASMRPVIVTAKPKPTTTASHPGQGEQVWADSKMADPGIVRRTRVVTGPMSLGILIETSLTAKGRRGALGDTLVDMLRHMGDDDEAFILTYDNDLVFEQDLTGDPKQLDEAMQEIKPHSGAKLDEAVAFAAGHLARIAKNPNRILLVISDGRNVDSHTPALQTSGMINASGVRIYCIGIGVDRLDGRSHLQALSEGTGGQSDFISDSSQLRGATRQIAQNIGIDFRF